ncbi:hypothetical protein FALBO_16265 [Fusarium albosuccineum]|uniref:DUF2293 domain-containing protein n=1 Tax=Fusarium albosuccineum TaxID=1237068 RepID=A0A8H4KL62_9HYPO|nr:hypothetical protein FALBO_16265 [Fusarium albosuccineum]
MEKSVCQSNSPHLQDTSLYFLGTPLLLNGAVFERKRRNKKSIFVFSEPLGIYVPREIIQKVNSDANAKKAMAKANWLHMLHKEYPDMPAKDRREIRRSYAAPFGRRTAEKQMRDTANAIRLHILDRYTEFKYPFHNLTAKEAPRAYQEVENILTIWRGNVKGSRSAE